MWSYRDKMIDLDEIDKKLIDALTLDARASGTTLSGQLRLARGTIGGSCR